MSSSDAWSLWIAGTLALAALLGAAMPAAAQQQNEEAVWKAPLELEAVPAADRLRAAATLIEHGEPSNLKRATALLEPIHARNPEYTRPAVGSVAYWLGTALERRGLADSAQAAWRQGVRALDRSGGFDPRLADAYLSSLAPPALRRNRARAVDLYRELLREVGPEVHGPQDAESVLESILRRRVAQMAVLMSDDALEEVIEQPRSAPVETWRFRPGAGEALLRWWRGQDTLPATPENERLEEHLTRLVYAQKHYACRPPADDPPPEGLDARGRLYLRLGQPWKVRDISKPDVRLLRQFSIYGVPASASDFPPAELWLYTHIDQAGHYLFAEVPPADCFTLAESLDLIPSRLKQSRGRTGRGSRYAYVGLLAMKMVYEQLALYHIDYANRYNTVANYISSQEMEAAARSGPFNRVLPPVVDRSVGIDPPSELLVRVVSRSRSEDWQDRRHRERQMPRRYSNLLEGAPQLPVAMRTTRFLTEDGRTRLEVHWGVQGQDLAAEDSTRAGPSLLAAAGTRYDTDYRRVTSPKRTIEIDSAAVPSDGFVSGRLRFGATDRPAHLSMQWDHYAVKQGSAGVLGRRRHRAVARDDSVEPLASGPALEMSDLVVRTGDAEAALNADRDAPLYPFDTITPQTPLLLSAEVYNLNTGEDGRTRYTLTYSVAERWSEGWRPVGGKAAETGTSTTVEGTSRRTDETIQLDLSAVDPIETSEVRVTVEVVDEVSGESVQRRLVFNVIPPGGRPAIGW